MQITFEKSCYRKNKYKTRQFAKMIARKANRTEETRKHKVTPYRCPFCGYFHIGHKTLRTTT